MKDIPIALIAAVNTLGYIGNEEGDLIVKCQRDLARFKELSKNGVLVMGRKTYESLPTALPGRAFVVITSNSRNIKHPESLKPNQTICVGNIESALEAAYRLAMLLDKERIVIAGGTSVYCRFLLDAETIHLTRFDNTDIGGALFPMGDFSKMIASDRMVKANDYSFYDGEMKVTFEEYQLTPAVESVVGDFVKLRTGARFRLSSLNTIIPLEDSVMIACNGCGFHVTENEAHLETLIKELDRLIEREAFSQAGASNDQLDSTLKLCANGE